VPEAVQPSAARARPVAKATPAPTRTINPGDRVCGQCGEGNDPARRFCRRCGASLQEAAVFSLPWYTRFWRRLTTRKVRAAGERPRTRRRAVGGAGKGWLTSWVTRLIALAIVVFVVLTFVGPFHHSIRNRLSSWYHDVVSTAHPKYNAVHPVAAVATSALRLHPAPLAIDNASNTSWQAAASASNGVGQRLSIVLAGPTDVRKLGFLIGDTDTPQAYVTQPRPEKVEVVFTSPARTTVDTKTFTLKDTPNFQSFGLNAKDVSRFTIIIESVYPSAQGHSVAITEVEPFTKS
jgi:hypothetical protein